MKSGNISSTAERPAVSPDGDQDARQSFREAAILARSGRYADAMALIRKARGAARWHGAEAFDLEARILAQQGRYHEAEACWREAQRLDGANPAYDEAVQRLRDARRPARRILRPVAAIALAVLFGLLFWQTAYVNPGIRDRQVAAASAIAALRRDLGASQDTSRQITQRVAELATALRGIDRHLSAELEALPSAASTAANRDAILARVDARSESVRKDLAGANERLRASRAAADSKRALGTKFLATGVADLTVTVGDSADRLDARVELVERRLADRLDGNAGAIRGDLARLPGALDATGTKQSLVAMKRQLAQIQATLGKLRPPPVQHPKNRRAPQQPHSPIKPNEIE